MRSVNEGVVLATYVVASFDEPLPTNLNTGITHAVLHPPAPSLTRHNRSSRLWQTRQHVHLRGMSPERPAGGQVRISRPKCLLRTLNTQLPHREGAASKE
jgi:hypothetical protein